jgi:hypothetical protein
VARFKRLVADWVFFVSRCLSRQEKLFGKVLGGQMLGDLELGGIERLQGSGIIASGFRLRWKEIITLG